MSAAMKKKLTIGQKCQTLEMCKIPGMAQCSITRDAGVSRGMVKITLKQKTKLEIRAKEKGICSRGHVNIRKSNDDMDLTTFELFTRGREKHVDISLLGNVSCEKAQKIAQHLKINNFKASKGWFKRWKMHFDLELYTVGQLIYKLFQVCGERNFVLVDSAELIHQEFKDVLPEYVEENVFHCDETVLY